MEIVPWPKAESIDGGEATTWRLTLDRDADQADLELARERIGMSDPEQGAVVTISGTRDLVVRLQWARYDGDAIAKSVRLVRLLVQVLPVDLVQGTPLSKWSVLAS